MVFFKFRVVFKTTSVCKPRLICHASFVVKTYDIIRGCIYMSYVKKNVQKKVEMNNDVITTKGVHVRQVISLDFE